MYSFYSKMKKCSDRNNEFSNTTYANIATFILRYPEKIPGITIFDLAKKCNTSASTITRFSLHVNHSTFKELKEDCTQYVKFIQEEEIKDHSSHLPTTLNTSTYMDQIFASLLQTKDMLNMIDIKHAINYIHNAKQISFFGSSFSNLIAQSGCDKFARLQLNAHSYYTLDAQAYAANELHPNDIAIIVSFSGKNKHILRIKRRLEKRKVPIIWITSNGELPLHTPNQVRLLVSNIAEQSLESPIIQEHALNTMMDILYLEYIRNYRI